MIVPRNRLLFWFAVVALPLSLIGAVYPAALAVSLSLIGGLILLVLADVALARGTFAGIRLELPPLIRMSRERDATLDLRIYNKGGRARTLRLALHMPREFQSASEELLATLPAQSEWSRLEWPCRPLQRGSYRLEFVFVEASSPLGFWGLRARLPAPCEIRVYPNLLQERRSLGMLFLHRGTFGMHAQRQIGKGREFENLRQYTAGDSYEDIHWKATAKKGHPVTKVFQIERTQEIYIAIDTSRLSARQNVLERFLTATLFVGLAAGQQGDLFGLLTFSDRVETFVRARNGKAHYNACRNAIYALEPCRVNPDYDEVCSFIRLRLRRRALIVFLTALDDPALAESFVRSIELVSRQHLILVNVVQPTGAAPLFSDPNVFRIDDLYEHLGGHLRWHNLQELDKVLQRKGVGFSILDNERLSAQLMAQYLNVKRRQLL